MRTSAGALLLSVGLLGGCGHNIERAAVWKEAPDRIHIHGSRHIESIAPQSFSDIDEEIDIIIDTSKVTIHDVADLRVEIDRTPRRGAAILLEANQDASPTTQLIIPTTPVGVDRDAPPMRSIFGWIAVDHDRRVEISVAVHDWFGGNRVGWMNGTYRLLSSPPKWYKPSSRGSVLQIHPSAPDIAPAP